MVFFYTAILVMSPSFALLLFNTRQLTFSTRQGRLCMCRDGYVEFFRYVHVYTAHLLVLSDGSRSMRAFVRCRDSFIVGNEQVSKRFCCFLSSFHECFLSYMNIRL